MGPSLGRLHVSETEGFFFNDVPKVGGYRSGQGVKGGKQN